MKKMHMNRKNILAVVLSLMLMATAFAGGAMLSTRAAAENAPTAPLADPSPAIAVTQKTASSVVGVSSYVQRWDRSTGETVDQLYGQGSGVVIAEGGYVLTNYHVIENCNSFKILMPDGEYVDAEIAGTDSSTDLAVLQVVERADELKPVEIGTTADLLVGSTVVAIGNPGGEVLSNTVTQGIVSALERSNVSAGARNTTRAINYIQHDAAINNGNSGGGLFNYKGQLVGINTLKYAGSSYSSVSFEGLGFAIPVETVYKNASDLIEYGKVRRAQMGIQAYEYSEDQGPEEPMSGYAPAGVYVGKVMENTPASEADLQQYDYIYSVNGVRVKSMMELTTELDKYNDGDTVTVQIVRYANIDLKSYTANNGYYSYFFGNTGTTYEAFEVSGGYQTIDVDITLRVLDD